MIKPHTVTLNLEIMMDLHEIGWGRGAWTGLIWLMIGTAGGLL
jgi:hypothetical protein